MRPITLTRVVHCQAPRSRVWKHVSDTLRLNRAIGNSTLAIVQRETTGLDRHEIRTRIAGVASAYTEHPFAWSEGEYFSFYRVFVGGPARTLVTRYDLADAPSGGCDVTVRIDITPRWSVLRPLVWIVTRISVGKIAQYIAAVDGEEIKVRGPLDGEALQLALGRIDDKQPRELVERLAQHLRAADDLELSPIRPFALANAWSADRFAVLRLCLEAVPAGLLELRWALLCPSCQTTVQLLPSLRDLEGKAHCHACDLRYDTDLDRAVEAQFFPHPSIRAIDARPFCIAGPALTPHVIAQLPLEADASGDMAVPAEAGRLRLFVRGGVVASVDVAPGAPSAADVSLEHGDVVPAHVSLAPRGALRIANRSGEGRHAKLERTEVVVDAATAHHVATMPEFRPLFGSEALRPRLALKVARVTIFFSDLCGSTALYSRVGDAAAFGFVSDCFAFGSEIVERHGGTLVKTIGDAQMAAFNDARAGVAATAEMLARWPAFAEAHPEARSVELKIGLYGGPCTVVTANGAIDYFGQTVNRAARVQHLAGPGEAVLEESLAQEVAGEHGMEVIERFEAKVKGIEESLPLVRLRAARALKD